MRAFFLGLIGLAIAILGVAWVNATWSLSYGVPTCSIFAVDCPSIVVFEQPNSNTYIGLAIAYFGVAIATLGFISSLSHRNWRLRTAKLTAKPREASLSG